MKRGYNERREIWRQVSLQQAAKFLVSREKRDNTHTRAECFDSLKQMETESQQAEVEVSTHTKLF